MSEKTILYLILVVVAVDLFIDYKVAMGLQEGSDKVKTIINNPLELLR